MFIMHNDVSHIDFFFVAFVSFFPPIIIFIMIINFLVRIQLIRVLQANKLIEENQLSNQQMSTISVDLLPEYVILLQMLAFLKLKNNQPAT